MENVTYVANSMPINQRFVLYRVQTATQHTTTYTEVYGYRTIMYYYNYIKVTDFHMHTIETPDTLRHRLLIF